MRENDFKIKRYAFFILIVIIAIAMISSGISKKLRMDVFETSASGNSLKHLTTFTALEKPVVITVNPEKKFQTITGFGGSFTEASASLINELSEGNREKIIKAYFSEEGANYSLTRTHINSCDFSLRNYSYANLPGDKSLSSFSIDEDKNDLIPMIKMAQKFSKQGFKIIASPWTAPPWMKDNNDWRGGKLLPEYRETWARYFSKYMEAYKKEGIDIWGITVENEPLGNDKNWESMHFSPEEMRDFVRDYLGPQLEKDGWGHVPILGYDQNRGEELEQWVKVLFEDKEAAKYFGGTAVHWYASTYDVFPKSLEYAANASPGKYLINTEACVDAQVPVWKNDSWYWNEEAKDWGWTWAPADQKYLHPKYVPVFRYARDIIGCLNNNVDGWIDWNMVLNRQGGPNWFKNWCTAPVIVDTALDEVYFTPLFYTMSHFSRFIRPGAVRIAFENADSTLMVTAAKNPDGSIAVIIFNPGDVRKSYSISLGKKIASAVVSSRAIQTIVIR